MADPQSYRPAPGSIPTDPGVYRFWDERERVIYVGKARSLRSRLSSYFQSPHGLHPRTQAMVEAAARVDWVVVGSEAEALSLEYTWIKEFAPRFNIKYRDDKSYPYLAVTLQEEFPRATVMRGERKRGVRYFGPYPQAWAIRETVDLLLRVFPVRSCSSGVFRDAQRSGRPCLLGYIDRCCAPCVGRVSAAEHREVAERFVDFMAGSSQKFIEQLRGQMDQAAQAQDYEQAARLRDDIGALVQATERNTLVFPDGGDFDVIVTAADDVQTA
ncbi:MAG: excinuclease ABC subunit UvrC, partial [Actinobacteria bacterium]|nr:excinuclease ABC subunit UvrC [Actinomycetota bacterium]